jgi:hypothetical protein
LKLPTFRHVVDSAGQPVPLQPFQGALPVLKLVAQPSTQLRLIRANLASFAESESGAATAVGAAGDVRRDAVRVTAPRVGRGGLAV